MFHSRSTLQKHRHKANRTRFRRDISIYMDWYEKRRDAGVGILVRKDRNVIVQEPDFLDPRVMGININVYGFKIRFVNAYSPTNIDGTENQKDDFYRKVKKAISTKSKHHKLIVLGDFNAQSSLPYKHCCFDGKNLVKDVECNDNGSRLKNLCRSKELCMIQTYFEHPVDERYTWYSNDGKTKKILDYILVEPFVQQYVTECKVHHECHVETDHRLLIATLNTPRCKKARWRVPKLKQTKKCDISKLKDDETKQAFITKLKHNMSTINSEIDPDTSEKIVESLQSAENATLPRATPDKAREIWKDDDVLNRLLNSRSELDKTSGEYKNITKLIKKRVCFLRTEKLKTEAALLNECASKRQIEELNRLFKNDGSTFKKQRRTNGCEPSKLKEFFEKHFTTSNTKIEPIELQDAPEFVQVLRQVSFEGIDSTAPEKEEIKKVISKLKNGKTGIDFNSTIIKVAMECEELLNEITKLFQSIWLTLKIPKSWGHSKLITLWKGASKGPIDDPSTYRGIQIGSTLCKVLVILILNRIQQWYDAQLLDQQQGFRSGRGTTDGIMLLKTLQQIAFKKKEKVFALFVDLSAAFDHVERSWLFKSIFQRINSEQHEKLFNLLKSLYSYTTTALDGNPQEIFEITIGVRQGGAESPSLYNLYMDYVMRIFMDVCKSRKIMFFRFKYKIPGSARSNTDRSNIDRYGNHIFDWLGYADDLVIAFADNGSLQKGITLLDEIFKRYHLKINISKTKTMIMNWTDPMYPETVCSLNGKKVDNVKTFVYLGCLVKHDEPYTGDAEITLRIDSAERKLYEHGKKFFNKRIALPVRVALFNSIVRSRLTYGCQTWVLTMEQTNRINACHTTMLRKMVRNGFHRKEGEWGYKLTNEHLLNICKTEKVDTFTHKLKRRYLAHIVRDDDEGLRKLATFNDETLTKSLRRTVISREICTEDEFYVRAREKEI